MPHHFNNQPVFPHQSLDPLAIDMVAFPILQPGRHPPVSPKRMRQPKLFELLNEDLIQKRCRFSSGRMILPAPARPQRLACRLQTFPFLSHQLYDFPEIRSWVFFSASIAIVCRPMIFCSFSISARSASASSLPAPFASPLCADSRKRSRHR